ncbi:hypothetical protein [Edaphobacter aggregans]|uniref:hypothetical protein n=1 Tax=Edaphobacter aggregans TaxID=570835 RepID=UPI0012FA0FB0|nr:hypothetical protein [Edaphobacter aggregans]
MAGGLGVRVGLGAREALFAFAELALAVEEVVLRAADVLPLLFVGLEGFGGRGEEAVLGVGDDLFEGLLGEGLGVGGEVFVGREVVLAIWRP